MVEKRYRRRRDRLRNALVLAVGCCGFFACFSWYMISSNRLHFPADIISGAERKAVRRRGTSTSPSSSSSRINDGPQPSTRERHRESYRHSLDGPASNVGSPHWKTDQYIVKAWLPRGIKERVEVSGSYETAVDYNNNNNKIVISTDKITSNTSVLLSPSASSSTSVVWSPANASKSLFSAYEGKYLRQKGIVSPPVKRLPQALIIGVKKCGTRALLEFLRVHPDIRASGPETHFFDRHYHRGLDWYRQQMPSSLEGQITMEKTPSYFITKEVPPRIHAMSPSVRVLVVVRDPVTRAVSDYTQSTSKRKGTPSFEEMAFLNISTGLVDTSWSAIRIGVYARFLDWWMKYFSLEQMLFISGETLIKDPAGEMGRVQDFLGLKRVISDKHFYFNETKGFPCLKKSEGSGNPHCLGKTKGRTHPDISLATVQRLRDFYRPFNMKFYQMVGRNFGWP